MSSSVLRFMQTIRARILLVLVLTMTVVAAVATYRAFERRNSDIEAARQRLQERSAAITQKQADVVAHAQDRLALLARLYDLDALARDSACHSRLVNFIGPDAHVAAIYLAAPDGRMRCTSLPDAGSVNYADRAYFQQALSSSDPIIGEPVYGKTTHRWVLPLAQSLRDGAGKIRGVVVYNLDMSSIHQEFGRMSLAQGERLSLIDSRGNVLARAPDPEHFVGNNVAQLPLFESLSSHGAGDIYETAGLDGVRRLYAVTHFAETSEGPVFLRLGIPMDAITLKADRQLFNALWQVMLLVSFASAAIWMLSLRMLVRPLDALLQAAQRLRQGDTKARTGMVYSNDEIGQLAAEFDNMAAVLASSNEVLRLNRALLVSSDCNRLLVHAQNETQLLNDICRLLVEQGGYRMAWIGFAEHDAGKSIRPVAHQGFEDGYLSNINISWDDSPRGQGPTGTAVRLGQAQVNQDFVSNPLLSPWRDAALKRGYASSSAFPLIYDGKPLGALTIYSSERYAFNPTEMQLLQELADDLAFGISNLRLQQAHDRNLVRLERSMEDTVQAIASTLELRDPYTAGHQRRVADLSVLIARKLGLSEEDIHGIALAGRVHDIGKIKIPAEILSKPVQLNVYEYSLLKEHAKAGYDILKGIDFPWPIADIVLQHHERLDGSGYPNGLKGEEILLQARIIAVADVVEAMSTMRPYRAALGIDVALQEIVSKRGVWFDPAAVDVCVEIFRNKEFSFD